MSEKKEHRTKECLYVCSWAPFFPKQVLYFVFSISILLIFQIQYSCSNLLLWNYRNPSYINYLLHKKQESKPCIYIINIYIYRYKFCSFYGLQLTMFVTVFYGQITNLVWPLQKGNSLMSLVWR